MYENFAIHSSNEKEADIIFFGALLGKKAKEMTKSLRKNSWFVEFFDLDKEKNLLENLKIFDAGDLKIKTGEEISMKIREILEKGKIPFMLSLSHLATYFALKAFPPDIKVISFDAHFDVKNSYTDEKIVESVFPLKMDGEKMKRFNRGTWVRRSFEESKREFCFVGVRSADEFELDFVKKNDFPFFTPKMIRENVEGVKKRIEEFVKGSKVYLTLDIDVFDPSIAPAVGYHEPDGIFLHHFQEILKVLKGRIVAADLVEIETLKESKVTEFLALKAMFEILFIIK